MEIKKKYYFHFQGNEVIEKAFVEMLSEYINVFLISNYIILTSFYEISWSLTATINLHLWMEICMCSSVHRQCWSLKSFRNNKKDRVTGCCGNQDVGAAINGVRYSSFDANRPLDLKLVENKLKMSFQRN